MRTRLRRYLKGLAVLAVMAVAVSARAATNIFAVVNSGISAYVINGSSNPDLRLARGFSYTFNVNASGHPFWIKTTQGTGTGNAYNDGVTGNGTTIGLIQFTVPTNAPSALFYNCQFHASMTGMLKVEDAPEVRITAISLGTNLVLESTGTDVLNLAVERRSNLLSGAWEPAPVVANAYSNGTNTTQIALPLSDADFVRVRQGLP